MTDPTQEDAKVTELSAKRERREDAEILLDEKGVFMLAIRSLRIRWFNELMVATERTVKDDLTARLKALTALPIELEGFIRDHKFALDRVRKHG
jgi:hypothetical protein